MPKKLPYVADGNGGIVMAMVMAIALQIVMVSVKSESDGLRPKA